MQPNDFKWIFKWENNPNNWEISGTEKSFSIEEIRNFVHIEQDLIINKQFRYLICLSDSKIPIGCVDLFNYDDKKKIAGVGILIEDEKHRNKGFAYESMDIIVQTAKQIHGLKQLFCNISPHNIKSIRLFEKCGFKFVEERELFKQKVYYYELEL